MDYNIKVKIEAIKALMNALSLGTNQLPYMISLKFFLFD